MTLHKAAYLINKTILAVLFLGFSLMMSAAAEERTDLEDVPEPPELPTPVQSGEPIEPEVTIIKKEGATISEYRINGRLYMIKVTPSVGKPYYLIDNDGDGSLESRVNDIYSNITVPQWILFQW